MACFPACALSMGTKDADDDAAGGHGRAAPGLFSTQPSFRDTPLNELRVRNLSLLDGRENIVLEGFSRENFQRPTCSISRVPLHFLNWHFFQIKMSLASLLFLKKMCASIPGNTTIDRSCPRAGRTTHSFSIAQHPKTGVRWAARHPGGLQKRFLPGCPAYKPSQSETLK